MNGFAIAFVCVNAVLLLMLPRRWAALPLLMAACYMPVGQGIDVGPFRFTVIRMLVVVGVLRVLVRGERVAGKVNELDGLMIAWAAWALVSSALHKSPSEQLVFCLGLTYNYLGIYFLVRIFCRSVDDVAMLCRITAVLLVPVAVEMVYEKVAVHNLFSALGGVHEIPDIREGRVRSNGPFAHAILAGTVGAVCLPLMVGLWRLERWVAVMGVLTCLAMVIVCASSGPILSAGAALLGLMMWPLRHRMRQIRWLAVLTYIVLDIVMKAPAYYLIARIDVAGGSTGYHRALLIQSALQHLPEWWLAGTDYTRHWMPLGVSWSEDHSDITNQYIGMGVIGGLPLMLLFIALMAKSFSMIGRTVRWRADLPPLKRYLVWALGCSLFAHAATCISISYFDQSFLFLCIVFAASGSLDAGWARGARRVRGEEAGPAAEPDPAAPGPPSEQRGLDGRACCGVGTGPVA